MSTSKTATLAIALAISALGYLGCSSDSTNGSTDNATTEPSASTGASGSTVNNCTADTAEDHTGDASTTIAFGGDLGDAYSPPCIKVAAGAKVEFAGDFASHPLRGGVEGTEDTSSPITATDTGTSKTITFAKAGTYGFYCNFHQSFGMEGAVFVE